MKKGKILLSGLLSIAVFGVFTNVNAESYVVNTLPETFTTRNAGHAATGNQYDTNSTDNDSVMECKASISDIGKFNVIDYRAKDTHNKIFCIDRKLEYQKNAIYTKAEEIKDQALAYIVGLSESYYNDNLAATAKSTPESTLDVVKKMEQSWLTQVAVWKRIGNTSTEPMDKMNFNILSDEISEQGVNNSSGSRWLYSKRAGALWAAADKLVEQAVTAAQPNEGIKFNFTGNYELNKDNKTVKTEVITSPYPIGIDLSKAPEGTKVYDKDGNELNSANVTSTFYLTFPINNVDEYAFDFEVPATTKGVGGYVGYRYNPQDSSKQPMMLVTNKSLTGKIHFKGSHVDDTASMISKSIYLVGFLILIAGVGMIYVNVRPKTSKDQI